MNEEKLDIGIKPHQSKQHRSHHWPVRGFVGMLLTIIAIFLILPFTDNFYAHLLLQGCFGILILSTIYTLSSEKIILFVGIGLFIPFLAFEILSISYNSMIFLMGSFLCFSVFILLTEVILVRKVVRTPVINTNMIFGAIMIYFFSGLIWANAYFIIDIAHPESFKGIFNIDAQLPSLSDSYEIHHEMLYYSFMVLTDMGLGDIIPSYHLTKSLTVLEAAFGQLFLAIVIAKLVTVWHHKE